MLNHLKVIALILAVFGVVALVTTGTGMSAGIDINFTGVLSYVVFLASFVGCLLAYQYLKGFVFGALSWNPNFTSEPAKFGERTLTWMLVIPAAAITAAVMPGFTASLGGIGGFLSILLFGAASATVDHLEVRLGLKSR